MEHTLYLDIKCHSILLVISVRLTHYFMDVKIKALDRTYLTGQSYIVSPELILSEPH